MQVTGLCYGVKTYNSGTGNPLKNFVAHEYYSLRCNPVIL